MDNLYVEYLESNQPLLQKSKSSIEKMILNLKSSKMAKMMVQEVETKVPKRIILPQT